MRLTIRPIRLDDAPRLQELHSRLSPETVYFRFLAGQRVLTEKVAVNLANVDYRTRMALVATTDQDGKEINVAVAGYDVLLDNPDAAEAAFVVEDSYQGKGLGTCLMERLVAYACGHGVKMFQFLLHFGNIRMLHLIRHSGSIVQRRQSFGECEVWTRLEPKPDHEIWRQMSLLP
jgi:GNAT superfamily N-acetyltransferase